MSIASEITSMGENLKKDYQSIANLGADLTNVDKNIENIAELLDGVYDHLPKTSFQEGTDVTIEGGLKGKLDFEDGKVGYGQASQDGEPTPSTPVEVKCVAGRNKFDISTQKTGKVYNRYNKTWDNSGEWNSSDYIKVNQNSSYVLSFGSFDSGMQVYVTYLENDKDYISGGTPTTITNLSVPITTPLNCEYIVFGYYNNKNATNIMLEEGTQATPYLPYNTIEIVESGKNLLKLANGTYSSGNVTAVVNNGIITLNGTSGSSVSTIAIPFTTTLNGEHTLSANNEAIGTSSNWTGMRLKENSSTTISSTQIYFITANASATFTLENKAVQVFELRLGTSVTYSNYVIKPQLEEGSTATDYEPYHTPITYPISLGNNKFYNIGTYRDYILRTTGKNLVNPTEIKDASINSTTGDTITYYSSSASKTYVKCAYVKQGVAYTFSKKPNTPSSSAGRIIDIVDDNEVILEAFSVLPSATSYTYTPNHSGWVYMVVDVNATEIQIEEGSTASDYQPYGVGNWYKYGEVGEILLDGTNQSFSGKSGFTTNHVFFTLPISDILAPPNNDTDVNMLSNYFLHCKINALASNRIGFGCRSDKMLGFGFTLESQLDTLEKANTWLTTHNIDVLYPLATPTYTPITGDLATQLEAFWNAHSNTGTTIIESNGDLPMIIKVRALKGES